MGTPLPVCAKIADKAPGTLCHYEFVAHPSRIKQESIKLGTISPIGRGEPEPPENPTDAAEAAVQRYVDEHPSEQVERYFDLLDAVEAATPKGFTPAAGTKIGPMAFFAGADRDLVDLCIGRR